ncbi:hypothetical protein P175DRAFT_0432895 [Aspergillus ochraceoroseus IBT 24754]|uniref:Glucan endo-1,3-beta-D-glucosidase 1 n=1 Tax=Aspergillus ochraceoroseus IBT 24754 TaxID=1392256 RepID=A0A2T5M400_9EURO|nr:uncharacterized protein P175DRAFT_0432895 [Aspergillus ochraceoroseus IBT 24754]PTU23259.1 hypothetical protein P175DRAFT_0432895 [Aspergillus ochraceoroseus IBT 24754]
MESRSTWSPSTMLIWLLAARTVYAAPRPTRLETPTSLKTQYPPSTQGARLLPPETQGFYPTKLEHEGHPYVEPTPTDSGNPFDVSDLLDTLGDSDTLLDWLLPGINLDDSDAAPSSPPEPLAWWTPTPRPKPSTSSDNHIYDLFSTRPPSSWIIGSSQSVTPNPSDTPTSTPLQVAQGSFITMATNQDVFIPLPTGAIPSVVSARNDHPVAKTGINSTGPIETNKFYAGFFLGTQSNATFTHPYSVFWAKGSGILQSWGMAVSHIEYNLVANGPTNSHIPGNPVSYYINPIGIQSVVLSATELSSSTVLTTEDPLPFSANAVLRPQAGSSQNIVFPVVQGMGYVTAVYTQLQPVIQSAVYFREVVTAGSPRPGIFKYRATLSDGTVWLLYLTPENGQDPDLKLVSTTNLQGPAGWSGTIQVAKNPGGTSGEKLFDNSSGVFPVQAAVSGSVTNNTGSYRLAWAKSGKDVQNTPLMMFALPHHVAAFDSTTKDRMTNITLRTTTKGIATAVIGEYWTMTEPDLPVTMDFAPWTPAAGSSPLLTAASQQVIASVAAVELQQSIENQTNLNSMYYSGKALSKFATLIYTVDQLLGDHASAAPALENLKKAYARFIQNGQQYPLVYDTVWKGVVSSASYNGGSTGADFGNTLYNDHHFHYGYFIHAAAIIGRLDPSWLPNNRDWVNMLVRDAGNAAADDPLFPFSRSFDWYHGHSWAKGLFESFDGKDQESTSEDTMFAYALKMWGKTIGDASMEARGNLMLGILRRSLHNYFLMDSDNTNQPANFIANKVTGILFENKIDHTTYFGNNLEYIQGIHMLPLLPSSSYVRSQKFVQEEWDAMFASGASDPAENVAGGWKGVLYANLALIRPASSWNFFAQSNFDYSWIDGGASRTWYLAYAAGEFPERVSY